MNSRIHKIDKENSLNEKSFNSPYISKENIFLYSKIIPSKLNKESLNSNTLKKSIIDSHYDKSIVKFNSPEINRNNLEKNSIFLEMHDLKQNKNILKLDMMNITEFNDDSMIETSIKNNHKKIFSLDLEENEEIEKSSENKSR